MRPKRSLCRYHISQQYTTGNRATWQGINFTRASISSHYQVKKESRWPSLQIVPIKASIVTKTWTPKRPEDKAEQESCKNPRSTRSCKRRLYYKASCSMYLLACRSRRELKGKQTS